MPKLVAVLAAGSDYTQPTNHIFKRVIHGDLETVRERLVRALKKMGYRVVSEHPLIARRERQASACSFDVLKCVKSLTIDLTAVSSTSTLATFDSEIINALVTKGDRQTIEREAEAIIALATAVLAEPVCVHCGMNNSSDSHFCRGCGASVEVSDPSELEVLRLTSGARPAHQFLVLGFVSALFFAALAMFLILFTGKTPKVGLSVLAAGEAFATLCFLYGIRRLHRTLNPARIEDEVVSLDPPRELRPATTTALPPHAAHRSVTEGTTEFLVPRESERVAVPVRAREVDTAEIG
ncbi:MAG: hypothetical protein QOJ64_3220 [Acidobacteriota bacterium]|jgi:ribosomal protein L40E|nr:hypothetical protein [Acidobacteriota bacterium]